MDSHLLEILAADNRWLVGEPIEQWFQRFLPPDFVQRRVRLEPDRRFQIIVGPRQTGKSTLVWKTLQDLGAPALFLNCEEPTIRQWLTSPALFSRDLESDFSQAEYVFIEEVQRLPEAGLFLKGVFDRHPRQAFFVTGSSSFDLEAVTRESMAGRAIRNLLLPFSVSELGQEFDGLPTLGRELKMAETTLSAALLGGYPSVRRTENPQRELSRLVEAFVLRDASDRFRIQHIDAFGKLLRLAAGQVGSLVNYSEWASITGVSRGTVRDYMRILEDSHIIRRLEPFVGGKRAEITGTPKVFFIDNGFRNLLAGGLVPFDGRADRGAVLENLVFSELAKAIHPILDTIRFWRSKSGAEVDFVVEHQGRFLPIEVKATKGPLVPSRSMHSFIEAYQPARFLVATLGDKEETTVGNTLIRQLPIHRLEAELGAWMAQVE